MTKCRFFSIILCLSLLLTSCSNGALGSEKIENELESMEKEPILEYKVPSVQPHILVNQIGYEPEGMKTVIFVGEDLPESFQIINKESLEAVYIGTLRDKGSAEEGNPYYGYGDFSDLTEEGEYYVQCDIWGRSYSFEIKEDIYQPTLETSLSFLEASQMNKKINAVIPDGSGMIKTLQGGWVTDSLNNQELAVAGEAFMTMIAAWELYPDAFNKDKSASVPLMIDRMKSQADWMLQLQDEKTGGVYGGVLANPKTNGILEYKLIEISDESSEIFAAALAAFSYVFQQYDKEYADLCLRAADKAWNYLLKVQADFGPEGFCAATQLYRASGQLSYHNVIKNYFEAGETISVDSAWELLGGITYLSTKMQVDTQLCEKLMKEVMEQAELISSEARAGFFLTEGNQELNNTDEILWNMVILGIADYVITNHEYATVIENHNHFFMGRNQQALSLLHGEGVDHLAEEDQLINNNLLYNAYYLFMLSQIMKEE